MKCIRIPLPVFLFLLLVPFAIGQAEEPLTLPLPDFVAKLIVVDDDLDLNEFQTFFTNAVQSHLQAYIPNAIPHNGNLRSGRPESIQLKTSITRNFLGSVDSAGVPVSMFRVDFTDGSADIVFADSDDKVLAEVRKNLAISDLRVAFEVSMMGEPFQALLRRIGANTVLDAAVKLQLDLDGDMLSEGNIAEATAGPAQPGNKKPVSPMTIAAMIIFILMMVTILGTCMLSRRQKRLAAKDKEAKKRKWKKSSESRREARLKREESLKKTDPDQWMDKMAEKMTSIPVRNIGSTSKSSKFRKQKPQIARPAFQGRKNSQENLFCIEEHNEDALREEDEEEEGSMEGSMEFGMGGRQFSDVDLASPEDYEPKFVGETVYL